MNGTNRITRAKFINGLRDLAAFLDVNLFFPVPPYEYTINVFPEGLTDAERRAAVDRLAAIMGVTATEHNGHYTANGQFGPVTYCLVAPGAEPARTDLDAGIAAILAGGPS